MDSHDLAGVIRSRATELGRSASALSDAAVGQSDAIARIYRGHDPGWSRVVAIAEVLGLELYIGPPRKDRSGSVMPLTRRASGPARWDQPVKDRALAELLARLADRWEALPDPAARDALAIAIAASLRLSGEPERERGPRYAALSGGSGGG